jgi:hypothetical protein
MTRKAFFAVAITTASLMLSAQIVIKPARIDFKGDKLGMSLAEFKAKHPMSGSCADEENVLVPKSDNATEKVAHGIIECTAPATIVNRDAKSTLYKFLDGKLYSILIGFPHDGFNEAMATAQEKYGAQTAGTTEQYQNYFGAKFSGRSSIWIRRGDVVFLKEYMDNLETSAMVMIDPADAKIADARLTKKKKDF